MLWLCLRFPNLPLEIFTRSHVSNTPAPLAITENNTIICSSVAAQAMGVKCGLTLNEANTLCENLQLYARKVSLETAALQELAQSIYNISPTVNVYDGSCLMLEIGSVKRLFGNVDNAVQRLLANLKDRGFTAHYGLASTPKAACIFAKHFANQTPCFNSAQQHINNSEFKALLAELPLNLLPKTQQHNFDQLGLHTVGDVMALPISAIGKRFGSDFLRYIGQLYGDIKDPQPSIEPPHHFLYSAFFDPAVEHTGGLLFAMKRLLGELKLYLRQHQWQSQHIEWRLIDHKGKVQTVAVRQDSIDFCEKRLLELSQLHLENVQLSAGIEQLSLFCNQFSSMVSQTTGLFERNTAPAHDELFGKLEARLGKGCVKRIHNRAKHIPELATKLVSTDDYTPQQEDAIELPLDVKRPTFLLPKPERIQQTDKGLYAHGKGKLSIIEGPERIETPWYSHMVCRDYFTARNENGEVYWIYHNRATNQWFTHGIFS